MPTLRQRQVASEIIAKRTRDKKIEDAYLSRLRTGYDAPDVVSRYNQAVFTAKHECWDELDQLREKYDLLIYGPDL